MQSNKDTIKESPNDFSSSISTKLTMLLKNKDVDEDEGEDEKPEAALKIVLLGDACAGKTSLCTKFTQHAFNSKYTPTSGVDFYSKRISLPKRSNVLLQLWDLGGHNIGAAQSMLQTYVYGANALLFVYDVTNMQSFENVIDWINIIKKIIQERSLRLYLVGNKTDLEHRRAISIGKNNTLAAKHRLESYYVSAKTGDNVELMFKTISAELLNIKMTPAELEWDISVVQAPVVADRLPFGGRAGGCQYSGSRGLYHDHPSHTVSASSSSGSAYAYTRQSGPTDELQKKDESLLKIIPSMNQPQSQLKPPLMYNRNSAVCTIS